MNESTLKTTFNYEDEKQRMEFQGNLGFLGLKPGEGVRMLIDNFNGLPRAEQEKIAKAYKKRAARRGEN